METKENGERFQWPAALGAGLIAGVVLLVAPRGSPWSGLTFLSPTIIGRLVPPSMGLSLPECWLIHLALSLVYGFIISLVASRLTQGRAIVGGGVIGVLLFLVNWGIISLAWPWWQTGLFAVIFAHLVFGLIAGASYRGLRRGRLASASPSN